MNRWPSLTVTTICAAFSGAGFAAPILLPVSVITVDASGGGQTDPHVSGNLVSYSNTAANEIRYYDFGTAANLGVPTSATAIDVLSDVSNGRIAFTRIAPGASNSIMLFDTTMPANPPVEINSLAGSNRVSSGIGGRSLAYADFNTLAAPAPGNIVHFDILTNAVTTLSSDAADEFLPRVSPDGNVVAWTRCVSLSNCDVMQSVWDGLGWNTSVVASTPMNEEQADTDGTFVAYISSTGISDWTLYLKPVSGGASQPLVLAGVEYAPAISGNIVSFQHIAAPGNNADIFLYDIATDRFFQITDTPNVNETLNDIFVFPDGRINLVWEADDDVNGNIYGATFFLPSVAPLPSTMLLCALALTGLACRRPIVRA